MTDIKPGSTFEINPETILPAEHKGWWERLAAEGRSFHVEEVIPAKDERVTLKGTLQKSWTLPGLAEPLEKIAVTVEVDAAKKVQLISLEGRLRKNGQEIKFHYATSRLNALLLVSEPVDPTWFTLPAFAPAELRRDKLFLALAKGLKCEYMSPLPLSKDAPEEFTLVAAVPDLSPAGFKIPLQHIRLSLTSTHYAAEKRDAVSLMGRAAIALADKNYDVFVRGVSASRIQFGISANHNESLPGPADLLRLMKLDDAADRLSNALKEIPVLGSLKVETVMLDVNAEQKKLIDLNVKGSFAIGQHTFNYSLSYAALRLFVFLAPDTPILLNDVLEKIFTEKNLLPAGMNVNVFSLDLQMSPLRFTMELGVAELWELTLGPTALKLSSVNMRVTKSSGAAFTGEVRGVLNIGDVDFSMSVKREKTDGGMAWFFRSDIANEEGGILLSDMLKKTAAHFDLPPLEFVPEIRLFNIQLAFNTGKDSDLQFDAQAELIKPLGPFNAASAEIHFHRKKNAQTGKAENQLELKGELEIAQTKLKLSADLGSSDWSLQASWEKAAGESLNLLDLVTTLNPAADLKAVPQSLRDALELDKLSFSYSHKNNTCVAKASNPTWKTEIVLLASKTDKGWGAALGIHYGSAEHTPEFGAHLAALSNDLFLEEAWVFFSWIPDGATEFNTGKSDISLPVDPKSLGKGLSFGATLDLIRSKSQGIARLKDAAGMTRFQVKGSIGKRDNIPELKFSVEWKGTLSFKTDASHPLVLKDCGFSLSISQKYIGVNVHGTLGFTLDNHPVTVQVAMDISTQSITLSGNAEVSDGGIPLFGLEDVRLYKLALLIGISFARPEVLLGLSGEMTFRKNQVQREYLGAVIGFSSPIPNPEFFAVDISKLSLAEMIRSFADKKWRDHNYISDDLAKIEGLSFRWAEKNMTLPDGTSAEAGTGFHGLFTIFGWKSWIEFSVSASSGFSAKGQFDPVHKDGFQVTGVSTDLWRTGVNENGKYVLVSNTKRLPKGAATTPIKIMDGGGAFIEFNSMHAPYLATDFTIKVLDAFQFHAGILVDDKGVKCKVVAHIEALYDLDLDVVIRPPEVISAAGTFSAGPRVKLPFPINQEVGLFIKGHQDIQTGTKQAFHFIWEYHYELLGAIIPGPVITINKAPDNFGDVVKIALDNFLNNSVGAVCRIILPEFWRGACDIFKGKQAVRAKTYHEAEHLPWVKSSMHYLQPAQKKLLNTNHENTAREFDQLLDLAETETNHEIEQMKTVYAETVRLHPERMRRGTARLEAQMAAMQKEMKDVDDPDGLLQTAIDGVWSEHLAAYEQLWIEHTQAALKSQIGQKAAFENIQNAIRSNCMNLAVTPHPEKGYTKGANGWAEAAVVHFFEIARIRHESDITARYILNEAHRHREEAKKSAEATTARKQPITITLKQIKE